MRRIVIPLLATLIPTLAHAEDALVPSVKKPKVEIVFAIDTTGSMGGLIDGAKRKIWAIANEVQKAQQKPEVRIGLVAFRDQGDEYVTKATPLTNDLDKVYETLMGLRADGGGDTPEDVNAALDAALTQMKWSDDKDTLKMIFLVGDAPPHMDYAQEIKWAVTAQSAVRKNIYINTVQCGADPETTTAWKGIAHAAEGRYAAIPQDGGVNVAIATPYDKDLDKLARDLDGTYMEYGSDHFKSEKKALRVRVTEAAKPAPVAADRAATKAMAADKADEDIIDLAKARGGAGSAIASMAPAALPEELKGKNAEEQRKIIDATATKRAALQKQIAELSKKREQAIADAKKKAPAAAKDAFDSEIVDALHAEAAATGVLTY